MKNRKLSILISLFTLLIFSCVKEDENPEMPTVSYQLVVSAEEGGSVSSSGGTFNSGSEVTLTATPNSGYAFTSWSNGSTQNPITITVNSDQQLTANFEKSKYALTINIIGKGEVKEEIINSSKGTDYEGGTTVKLTPIPDSNWDFYWWNKAVSDNTLIKEITIDAPTTLDVTFDYASGKKMIGSWNLGPTNNASFLKKNSTADLYLIIDYALNFILVNSEDSTIDATELSTAAFGILDPTSPQEFEMIFGLLLGEDRSEDFSSEDFPIVNMTMSSSDFGTDANGSFDISMEFPSSNSSDLSSTLVDFSLSNTTLDVPLTENGLLSPTRDVSGTLLEQASLSLGVLEEFQKDVVDILGDDTLFPNICITEITSIELSSDNDNNSISCDENIKVTAAMGRAVLAPVELVMTDHDGNAQVIGMTPVTTSALSSIDLTTQTFSEWEVNLTRSGPLNWIDVSTDNAVTLTVSHTCYTGSEELTYDLLEACTETSSATISYQVRSTDETSYVTQNEENYGKVYCGDVLKFDISLPTAHGGSVHLKLTYADGTEEIVSMGPVGSVPTADWSMNNVTLQEERYGNVTVAAVLDYTSTDEKTLESDLVLDYQEGVGCVACEEITSIELSSNNDDNSISCEEDIKVTVDFPEDVLAPVELIMTDKDGNFETIGMTPVTATPSSSIDLTTTAFNQWEVNITRSGALNWIDVSTDNTVSLTVSHTCYTGSDELSYDLLEACDDAEVLGFIRKYIFNESTQWYTLGDFGLINPDCRETTEADIVYTGEKIRYYARTYTELETLHFKITDQAGAEEMFTAIPLDDNTNTIDNLYDPNPDAASTAKSFHWYFDYDYSDKDGAYTIEPYILDKEKSIYAQQYDDGVREEDKVKLVHNVVSGDREEIISGMTYKIQPENSSISYSLSLANNGPYGTIKTTDKILFTIETVCAVATEFKIVVFYPNGEEEIIPLTQNQNSGQAPYFSQYSSNFAEGWYVNSEHLEDNAGEISVTVYKNSTIGAPNTKIWQVVKDPLGYSFDSDNQDIFTVPGVLTAKINVIPGASLTDCEDITSIELSSNNDNNSISCEEDIKVTVDFQEDVLAPVELIMTDKDGNFETIGMTPVTATPSSSIDLTTTAFNQWEVNITRSGALNWIDVSTDNTVTLTVSHTCYTGSEELTYDLLEACTETSSAAISYQVRSTDETSYVTQNEENYGKVYCGDVLKFDISLPTAHGGSVHLKLTYADGTDEIVSMGPVGSVPTADWSMNNVTLQEERYGNVTVAAVLDYTSTDEKTLESDLVLDYQEGDGCLSDALPYATLNYQVLKNGEWDDFKKFYVDQARQVEVDGIIYSDESVKFNATFDQAVEGDVKIRVDYRVNSNSTNIGVQYFDMQPVGGTTPNTEWELIYSQELLAEDFPNSDEIKNNAEELGISLSIGYDPETTQYIDRQVWESEDLPATLRLEYFLALSATVTYEIKGTDGNWITQTEENYGTVFCNDLVRYNIAFSRPLNGRETNNVDLLIYYNGGGNTIDVHDLSPIDTNDLSLWQSNEIKLEGEYGTAFWLVRLLNQYNRVINEDLGVDVFDFQQAETGCGDTAEISYQILELGTENYITQEGDAYGTVYCNDTLKFDVTLSRAHNGSVHLRAVYADGSESYISLAPAEELPTASWTLNNIKLSGAYGNVNFNAVVDYTSENEKVVETETLTISFNEAETGCD